MKIFVIKELKDKEDLLGRLFLILKSLPAGIKIYLMSATDSYQTVVKNIEADHGVKLH